MQHKQVIYIEGSIGNGKSTTLNQLKEVNIKGSKIHVIPEPIQIWDKYQQNGKTILQLFYEDRQRYCLPFQLILMKALVDQFKQIPNDCNIVIVERSVYSQRNIFVESLMQSGNMNSLDLQVFEDLSNDIWKPVELDLQQKGFTFKYVHIDTNVQKAFERIQTRGRQGEEMISIEYLQQLYQLHVTWMKTIPHLVINNDKDGLLSNELIHQILFKSV